MKYTIEKITALIGARRYGNANAEISFLLTDSRSLCFPEETIFFALKTTRNDGHKYISELYKRGVRNFVVNNINNDGKNLHKVYADANFLEVVNTLEALQRLVERHRDEFNIPIVGITGSNGKTVVKEWLYQLMRPTKKIVRSPKSYNSQIGVPLSVWLLNEQTELGLFEAGISMPGEMQALRDIIQPTVGIFTHLGPAHQENFRSLEEKCLEKLELFKDVNTLVYSSENAIIYRSLRRFGYRGRKVSWSREDPSATFYVRNMSQVEINGNAAMHIEYVWNDSMDPKNDYRPMEGNFNIPFIDDASIENALTVATSALILGITAEELSERMPTLEPVAMRLEVKEGSNGCTLINDSYNADINSLDIALDFMNRRPDHQGRKRTVILSDIYQSGMPLDELYQRVNALLNERFIDKFIGIGKDVSSRSSVFTLKETHTFPTVEAFMRSSIFHSLHNEVILIKGARAFGFERITEQLVQKVHETILEVNLNAIVDNLNEYRAYIQPSTKLVCMIKADAYGAGAVEIAKTLQDHRVDYLAVAVADEGVTLRKAGITANIMVMNPEMSSFKTLFEYELEPEVYSFRLLDALIKAARKEGIANWPIHIKLDTGMHRLGFNVNTDMDELISQLKKQVALIPRSVFSHFVGADSDGFDEFSKKQFELFTKGADTLQKVFSHKILRHMDNSAGIEHFPERQMDMCRLGIGLYGVNPRDNRMLHNVSTLKTTILQIRNVPANETVGYSRKGVLKRDSVIAAIPIGYADGLNRHLGNGRCYCLVNGQKAPYVGNICMDVAMIDVTGIPCKEGDKVEIFGDNLPITVLSDVLETIPYEVLTSVSNRVKRIYYQD